MIKFEKTEVMGWEAAIRGMRNPMNSWEKSDSGKMYWNGTWYTPDPVLRSYFTDYGMNLLIGPNDLDLMKRLRNAGTDHRKFMRMITVYVDITAPLYWWKEFDTYKVGTVANSCSTMHKIHAKEFTLEDFSCEHLLSLDDNGAGFDYPCAVRNPKNQNELVNGECVAASLECLRLTIDVLNVMRHRYLKTKSKLYWWQMIQLLPSSYNQKRTIMLNYEVLANIYKSRRNHKLDEWALSAVDQYIAANPEDPNGSKSGRKGFGFCDWIHTLPYSELITGDFGKEV